MADERVSQAEQRAIKAEEAAQAQEGLIEQLCNENLKLGEEIQRLNTRSAPALVMVLQLSSQCMGAILVHQCSLLVFDGVVPLSVL